MNGRRTKLINGSLILISSLVIFILAKWLLESGAADIESRIAALFLLLNPVIALVGFIIGIRATFIYSSAVIILTHIFINVYSAGNLLPLVWSYIFTCIVTVLAVKNLHSKVKDYDPRLNYLNERITELNKLSIENERIKVALERKLERFSALKTVNEELGMTLTLDEVVRLATDKILEIIPKAQLVLVYLVDEKQDLILSSVKAKGESIQTEDIEVDVFDRWILRHSVPLIVMDAQKDFRFGHIALDEMKRDVRSLISVPFMLEENILGILRLESLIPEGFNPDDLRITDIFSDLVAVAIENSLLYSRMNELARKDSLTGLFIPRYFYSQLEEMINRNSLKQEPISLLMLDIDYFKEYNDRYGHLAGDLLLKQIAQDLSRDLSGEDFAVRYGGEEFVVVLSGAVLTQAIKRAQTIRQEIAARIFHLRRQETHITVSIGIATYPADGKTKEELLHKADEWLYYAKEKGRNRVAYAGINKQ